MTRPGTEVGRHKTHRAPASGRHLGSQGLRGAVRSTWAVFALACAVLSGVVVAGGLLRTGAPSDEPGNGFSSSPATAEKVLPDPPRPSVKRSPRAPSDRPVERPSPPSKPDAPLRIPEAGTGLFDRASIDREASNATLSYSLEVERGLPIPAARFAAIVRPTLADPRGWAEGDPTALAMTNGTADLRIVLTTPETTDRLCAPLQTGGRLSCRNGRDVVINAWRWTYGAPAYGADLSSYRRYLINHEVGHALGNGHASCPARGALAPVMLQQTKGLQGCRSNPWPARADLLDR